MPVVRILGEEATRLAPAEYTNEDQLQQLLAEYPYVLMGDDEPDLSLVAREVTLPGAGRLDLLLVDAEGRPTAVEVKLRRNVQSRREVVAQVFDYVAALADFTAAELDQHLGGKLGQALAEFEDDSEEDRADQRRWGACRDALRAGKVRVVIAVDSAGQDLVRLVRFINDHSDLDVRLVEIGRFSDGGGGTTLVPKVLVRTREDSGAHGAATRRKRKAPRPEFEEVVQLYDARAPAGLQTCNRAAAYRFFTPEGWPGGLHYEFMDRGSSVTAELHIETDKALCVRPAVEATLGKIREAMPECRVVFDPRWSKGRGRLVVHPPDGAPAADVGVAMETLYEATYTKVSQALAPPV